MYLPSGRVERTNGLKAGRALMTSDSVNCERGRKTWRKFARPVACDWESVPRWVTSGACGTYSGGGEVCVHKVYTSFSEVSFPSSKGDHHDRKHLVCFSPCSHSWLAAHVASDDRLVLFDISLIV